LKFLQTKGRTLKTTFGVEKLQMISKGMSGKSSQDSGKVLLLSDGVTESGFSAVVK
jgi:hypothetical protein